VTIPEQFTYTPSPGGGGPRRTSGRSTSSTPSRPGAGGGPAGWSPWSRRPHRDPAGRGRRLRGRLVAAPGRRGQQSTGNAAPYLPFNPGTGNGSQSGGGTGTGNGNGTGSGATGSGATGATDSQVAAVAAKVDPALVDINTVLGYQNGEAAGTGIVISSDGRGAHQQPRGRGRHQHHRHRHRQPPELPGRVVGYDRSGDIAVLRLSGASGLATATLAEGVTVKQGDPVVAIGNAGGTGGTRARSARGLRAQPVDHRQDESSGSSEQLTGLIEVSADIQAGDSGGPLLTTSAR